MAKKSRPNVLFVSVDQWPGRLMQAAGHGVIETPTLTRLAQNGTRFERAYSECPICIPARRSMFTGTSPRVHGDRIFQPATRMPNLPTLAQTFRDSGYQATAVGKIHVYPQRDRIGFDDVHLVEEGRPQLGAIDDYDLFLADKGHPGEQFMHGMSNNEYSWRSWHLDDSLHVTNWLTQTMCRQIKRRDPDRPAFWHLSYTHPHPPLAPLAAYFERYARKEIDPAVYGDWAKDFDALPPALKLVRYFWEQLSPDMLADAKRAFYAACTHIDHQLRTVIGTLREELLLDDTIILVTGDHGDMLGDHGLYAKRYLYEGSVNVPMILVGPTGNDRVAPGVVDNRLVGLQDIMPTLLDLAGIDTPETCTGISMVGDEKRETFYSEALEDGVKATRMISDGRYKLIWYPGGNHFQLFDIETDPKELKDLSADTQHADILSRLRGVLAGELYGGDLEWVRDGELVGCEVEEPTAPLNRGLSGQRGHHYPPPPLDDPSKVVGMA